MRNKVLLLGDSLGLPRPNGEIIESQTWSCIVADDLRNEFKFYHQFFGGLHSVRLINERAGGYLGGFDPDIVVLQIGIVEASPRVLKDWERYIISKIPVFRDYVRRIIRRHHACLSLYRHLTYTNPIQFKKNLLKIKASFPNKPVLVIPIAPASDGYIHMAPMIIDNIEVYNDILFQVFTSLFISDAYAEANVSELFLSDNHHLSAYGHAFLAEKVKRALLTVQAI